MTKYRVFLLRSSLEAFMKFRDQEFPNGEYLELDKLIKNLRYTLDIEIKKAGLWPDKRLDVCNQEALNLIREVEKGYEND